MTEIVRVKDPISGHEYDVPRSRLVVCPDLHVIDKPTGPSKPRLPLGTPIPGGKVARKRATAKKSSAAKKTAAEKNDSTAVATEKEN